MTAELVLTREDRLYFPLIKTVFGPFSLSVAFQSAETKHSEVQSFVLFV